MSYRNLEIKIGEDLDIPMWSALTSEEKNDIMDNPDIKIKKKYYHVNFTEFKGVVLLNVIYYNPFSNLLISGKKAIYTLNINTNKPTAKSKIRKKLSDQTLELIHNYLQLREKVLNEMES